MNFLLAVQTFLETVQNCLWNGCVWIGQNRRWNFRIRWKRPDFWMCCVMEIFAGCLQISV